MYEFFSETVMYGGLAAVVLLWSYIGIDRLTTVDLTTDGVDIKPALRVVGETVVGTVVVVLVFAGLGLIVRGVSRLLGYQLPAV